ncbi:ABC transporter ATP-binding protein [Olivibacter ginsenosidimutans]|uniref:ABC transporter ATP-binding protein n=1 Tax=Olivibacter ginsenosidimutans TaxID=1176537 RepID=A0ABP9AXU6_9SPHI
MITVKNISYAYRKNKAVLEQINLHFKAGHIYGLLGENGAGKTTLLKSLAGLVFPLSGDIEALGHEPAKRSPDFLAEIFFIPEDFVLPAVTPKRYLQVMAPFYPKFNHELFYQFMEEFSIPQETNLEQLSFGQRKKVLIAFGLATKTRILLMDEPTNGLDIPSKSQFRKVMACELTEDRCFIISTHQVRDLDNLIDELVILSQTRMVLATSMQQISETLVFKVFHEVPADALYAEQSISGVKAILLNTLKEDTKIDIELFFKSLLLVPNKIISALNNKTINHEQYI